MPSCNSILRKFSSRKPFAFRKTEEVRLEPFVFGQHRADVLVRGGVDVEIHAAIRLAERHADQSFGVDYLFHTLEISTKVIYSFYQNGIYSPVLGIEVREDSAELCNRKH